MLTWKTKLIASLGTGRILTPLEEKPRRHSPEIREIVLLYALRPGMTVVSLRPPEHLSKHNFLGAFGD